MQLLDAAAPAVKRAGALACTPDLGLRLASTILGTSIFTVTMRVNSLAKLRKLFLRKQFVREREESVCLNGASSFAA